MRVIWHALLLITRVPPAAPLAAPLSAARRRATRAPRDRSMRGYIYIYIIDDPIHLKAGTVPMFEWPEKCNLNVEGIGPFKALCQPWSSSPAGNATYVYPMLPALLVLASSSSVDLSSQPTRSICVSFSEGSSSSSDGSCAIVELCHLAQPVRAGPAHECHVPWNDVQLPERHLRGGLQRQQHVCDRRLSRTVWLRERDDHLRLQLGIIHRARVLRAGRS
eukprot:COSAG06_NODE_8540_length_2135_cov_1.685167_2_plen_220_part_00